MQPHRANRRARRRSARYLLLVLGAAAAVLFSVPDRASGQPLARDEIVDLQWQLALRGYDPGPADGTVGRRTSRAIAAYQADAGLAVDGRASSGLLDHLRFHLPAVRNPDPSADTALVPAPAAGGAVTPMPPAVRDEVIRAYTAGIQEELAGHGYAVGPADGILGPRTRAAIRRYQARSGLPVDGAVSLALLNHLRFVAVGAVAAE